MIGDGAIVRPEIVLQPATLHRHARSAWPKMIITGAGDDHDLVGAVGADHPSKQWQSTEHPIMPHTALTEVASAGGARVYGPSRFETGRRPYCRVERNYLLIVHYRPFSGGFRQISGDSAR